MLAGVSVALMLLTASAAPAGQRLAVVELATPPNMIGLGSQVTRELLRVAQSQGYVVIPPDEVREAIGQREFQALEACGGGPSCVAAKLSALRVDRAVVGSLSRDEKSYLLKLWLIDVPGLRVVADVDRAILIASRRFMQDATEAIPPLLRGEREAVGTLTLTSKVKKAQVWIDGELAGITPLTVELKPGKHQLRVEKKSYLPVERFVAVEANQVTTEEVRMLLAPGEKAEPDAPEVATAATTATSASSLPRVPVLGWVGFGTALVAGTGAVVFGTMSRNLERSLEDSYDPNTDRYGGTRAQALEGQRDAVIANVCFGVAGAALAAGVVFTVLDNLAPEGAIQVAPTAGPSGAGVLLQGRF